MIDVAQQINAVARSVGARVLGAGEARVVIVSQAYDAPSDDRALRSAQRLRCDLGVRRRRDLDRAAADERRRRRRAWSCTTSRASTTSAGGSSDQQRSGVGWDLGLVGLALHLATGAAVDPPAGAAWMASDHGREFMTFSSEAWFAANVAGDATEPDARDAARSHDRRVRRGA